MNYKTIFFIYLAILINVSIQAQSVFEISGKILVAESKEAMEYCSISLHSQKDSSLVTGGISNAKGFFKLETNSADRYFLKINYIGFETKIVPNIVLNNEKPFYNAKNIYLQTDAKQVNEVEVTATRSTVRYQMDKKVVSVDKNIAAESGTAADVLESVPSVTVDGDGNVKLRGKSNFLVLIDGKPTLLQASEALQQIPANSIKNIEIITNPSAKYQAENSAGILNIILKEEKKEGTSGLLSVNGGTFNNYGGTANIKHNIKKFSFEFSASLRNRSRPRDRYDSLRTSFTDPLVTITDNKELTTYGGFNFNYSVAYNFAKGHNLGLDFVYGAWSMVEDDENFYYRTNEATGIVSAFRNKNDTKRGAPYFGPSLSYNGNFAKKSNLKLFISYSNRNFKEQVQNLSYQGDVNIAGQKSIEEGMTHRIQSKADYTFFIKKGKVELGAQASNFWNEDLNNYFDQDTNASQFVPSDINDLIVAFNQNIYGVYASYSNKFKKFDYSLGLRAEYTDRSIAIAQRNQQFDYYQWNFFPSLQMAYHIDESQQLYLSYSTRINRPRSWYLEPLAIKTAANEFYSGDPNIIPTIVYSVEMGWSKNFKKNVRFSLEAFYKYNDNVIEFVKFGNIDNSITNQPANIGVEQNIGLESNFTMKPLKFWDIELTPTGYFTSLKGNFRETIFDKNFFEWSVRLNNYFTVTKSTKIQFVTQYRSGRQNALGSQSDNLRFDIGVKQSFLKKTLNVALNARNVFNTVRNNGTNEAQNYYYFYESVPNWPNINLTISYLINNYKPSRKATGNASGEF